MARLRRDGARARAVTKRKLNDAFVRKLKPPAGPYPTLVWDLKVGGLALSVQLSGRKTWKCIYSFNRRPRWMTIGTADVMDVDTARKQAAGILLKVQTGVDVLAEQQAQRGLGTFEELANRYRDEYAVKKNKSWKQSRDLIDKHIIPRWGKLQAAGISRSDVKSALAAIVSDSTATQTLRAAQAVFTWAIKEEIGGIKVNPCQRMDVAESESRERVLSDSEVPKFWEAFDDAGLVRSSALKMILLTGQRPGEVAGMRREHIIDGWWEMPGKPIPALKWEGTKNGENHRVWLPPQARAIIGA
jgi:hypothetical protein